MWGGNLGNSGTFAVQ